MRFLFVQSIIKVILDSLTLLKQHPHVHIIFKEGLEEIESQIHLMTKHDDILDHSLKYLEN